MMLSLFLSHAFIICDGPHPFWIMIMPICRDSPPPSVASSVPFKPMSSASVSPISRWISSGSSSGVHIPFALDAPALPTSRMVLAPSLRRNDRKVGCRLSDPGSDDCDSEERCRVGSDAFVTAKLVLFFLGVGASVTAKLALFLGPFRDSVRIAQEQTRGLFRETPIGNQSETWPTETWPDSACDFAGNAICSRRKKRPPRR